MNIIIPIGGIGRRFSEDGYLSPKPFIKALGKPILFWNLENLKIDEDDIIYILYRSEFEDFSFKDVIINKFRKINFRFIPLFNDTRGSSETVLYALQDMSKSELEQLTIVVDSDNFYVDDIIGISKNLNRNLIFYKKDYENNPIYSYLDVCDDLVTDIVEKKKISDNACVGAYCFESGDLLMKTIQSVIFNGEKQNNEYYISSLYRNMIESGINVYSKEIFDFTCLGTPSQLKSFSSNLNTSSTKYRFCFDLDNTLVTYPEIAGDYSTVRPIDRVISFLNFLRSQGHTIIIQTARRMKTHSGNVGKVQADISKVTFDTLDRFNISYDEIYFGKPYADFYIDDLSVKPSDDLEKETGFYNIHPETRDHNKIEIFDRYIIKYSNQIDGEKFFYKNVPNGLGHLFPSLLGDSDNSIILEKIGGIPLSFLNVNKTLSRKVLISLLESLNNIHNFKFDFDEDVDIYGNYSSKLVERIESFDFSEYKDFDKVSSDVLHFLSEYEKNKLGQIGIIHGDPVLTNILIDHNDNLKMIDMRGKIGNNLTIIGDIFYDYSKVYQSIIGYDFILMGREIDNNWTMSNKKIFEDYISSKFGVDRVIDIKNITKSLLISLIPIHNNDKCHKFYDLISKI